MNIRNKRLTITATLLFITGLVFLGLENTFYQYVDNVGILHESLFLPLGVFCLLGGGLIAFYLIIKRLNYK